MHNCAMYVERQFSSTQLLRPGLDVSLVTSRGIVPVWGNTEEHYWLPAILAKIVVGRSWTIHWSHQSNGLPMVAGCHSQRE